MIYVLERDIVNNITKKAKNPSKGGKKKTYSSEQIIYLRFIILTYYLMTIPFTMLIITIHHYF